MLNTYLPRLSVRGLVAGYAHDAVISGVSFDLDRGEVLTMVGPNGSGKSTLIRCLMGLIRIWAGRIELDGIDVAGVAPHELARRGMTAVLQENSAFRSLTVEENLEVGGFILSRHARRRRLHDVLNQVPLLQSERHHMVGDLSTGLQRLVGIARAMMIEPVMLLLDEPLAGLSNRSEDGITTLLSDLASEGRSLLVVEHVRRDAIFERGRVIELNPAEQTTGPSVAIPMVARRA